MGVAAIAMVENAHEQGIAIDKALDLALAPMALDCLEAIMPEGSCQESYLVLRTMQVVTAVEGGSWATLNRLESDVALCLSSLLRKPLAFDRTAWDLRVTRALSPYLEALDLG